MSKKEFLAQLRKGLSGLPQEETEARLLFYSEMIDDRMEEGLSEEAAVLAAGSVDAIVAQTVAEIPLAKIANERTKTQRRLKAWEIVLLVLGSPIWLSLGIAAFAVILSLYMSLWSVVISLWAGFVSLICCALVGIVAGIGFILVGNGLAGGAMIGVGIFCAGLAIFAFFGCKAATKGTALFAKKFVLWIKNCFMRKTTMIWLAVAISLVLAGCIIFGGVMTAMKWDFTKLSTVQYVTSEYEINEGYKDISIVTDTADIVLVPSEQGKHSVVCYEEKNTKHSVSVKDGTLVIELADTRKWHERIGFNFSTPKITVSVPQGEYGAFTLRAGTGDVEIPKEFIFESIDISQSTGNVASFASTSEGIKIKTSTGKIHVEDITAKSLELSVTTGGITVSNVDCREDVELNVSTGKADFTDIRCKNVRSKGNTGDINLNNVIAMEKFILERTTGDILFEGCDAAELSVQTDTGHVTGSLLTDKVFIARTNTGKVDVPKTMTGGKCEILTDTGDIKIMVGSFLN